MIRIGKFERESLITINNILYNVIVSDTYYMLVSVSDEKMFFIDRQVRPSGKITFAHRRAKNNNIRQFIPLDDIKKNGIYNILKKLENENKNTLSGL